MREFHKRISEALSKGLRPSERLPRGAPFLKEAFNVKVTEFGMESINPVNDPFNGSQSVTFPFPQIIIGEEETLLADKRDISSVDTTVSPWEPTVLNVYEGRNKGTLATIPEGGQWHFIDLKDSWYLMNGECVVFNTRHDQLGGKSRKILMINDVSVNTGIEYRGRVVTGGFDPSNVWGDAWKNLFNRWRESIDKQILFEFDDIGENYVMWSSIGGGDFPLWLFYPELAMKGYLPTTNFNYDIQSSFLIETLQRNEWGFLPIPSQGKILKILPLGDALIIYGEEATTALIPTNPREGSIAPTFGVQHLMNVGIADRGAVAGNRGGHIMVDGGGSLWAINPDLSTNRIGYDEFFEPMLGNDIIVSLDEQKSEFYISDKNNCYILDRGLSETFQRTTSVDFVGGEAQGLFTKKQYEAADDERVIIVSNPLNMQASSLKTVTAISLGIRSPHKVEVALDYTTDKEETWNRTHFVPVNDEGNAELKVNGLDFRVVLKVSNYANFELDFIEVRFQPDDRRFVRGTSVNSSDS